ncbi:Solute carrier family 25 member 33 [Trichoplax sp. H2]|nr:Solute carrier family 25 member 33 [Trichoplax sp. H2]|eukprot:RDD41078.1 Solute carrier family 25 member 33 [Trichoplax sp. H2]
MIEAIMQDNRQFIINLVAGGLGGTLGAVATMPLEVLKTRGQSSTASIRSLHLPSNMVTATATLPTSTTLVGWIRYILATEGPTAFFKGLIPTLAGVAPTRALYLASYDASKSFFSNDLPKDASITHGLSAATGTFLTCTIMSPLWVVKTRMQLHIDTKNQILPVKTCCQQIYQSDGWRGFYRGLTASYIGISESMVYFVIYEWLKKIISRKRGDQSISASTFGNYTVAAAISKAVASISTYPYEVVRTRLREKGSRGRYNTFYQTLTKIAREEGRIGLYGGLSLQLIRSVPNTAIIFATYEYVKFHLEKNLGIVPN